MDETENPDEPPAVPRVVAVINALGMDAVAVALVWMAVFARATGTKLILAEYGVLGVAVWAVYVLDRVLDGGSGALAVRRARHDLAWRWRWWLVPAVLMGGYVAVWVALRELRLVVVESGVRLAVAVAAYFLLTLLSRRKGAGNAGPLCVMGLFAFVLVQGPPSQAPLAQLWRPVLGGFCLAGMYLVLRGKRDLPAAWILPRKALGAWLFAFGCALAPHAHIEAWRDLLGGNEVLIFASVCLLNTLLIRLVEGGGAGGEERSLARIYPGMALTVAVGGVMQCVYADRWARPLFAAAAVAAGLLVLLWVVRRRVPGGLVPLLADAAVLLPGVAVMVLVPGR